MMKSQFEKDFEAYEKELLKDAIPVIGWTMRDGEAVELTQEELAKFKELLDTEDKLD